MIDKLLARYLRWRGWIVFETLLPELADGSIELHLSGEKFCDHFIAEYRGYVGVDYASVVKRHKSP